jgi:heme exporter protein A
LKFQPWPFSKIYRKPCPLLFLAGDAMTDAVMIDAKALTLSRGVREIISAVDLRLERGSALIITGVNGSGKTTLLRSLAGLLPPRSGRITINGSALDEDRTGVMSSIIYIGHRDGFSGPLTVSENLRLWAESRGSGKAEIAAGLEAALDVLELEDFADTPFYMLSEGQRKKCGLARLPLSMSMSMAVKKNQPSCWLLDEPLTGLDTASAKTVAGLIDRFTKSGGTAVLTTHQDITLSRSRRLNLDKGHLS